MKHLKNPYLPAILSLTILFSCSPEKQTKDIQTAFMSARSICVYGKKVIDRQGDLELKPGDFVAWKGNGSLSWEVEPQAKDDYEFYLIANVGKAGEGTRIQVQTENENYEFTLPETRGPFPGGENFQLKEAKNFQRFRLPGPIRLEAGHQTITLLTSGIESEEVLFDFRSAEFLPLSIKEEVLREEERACKARADFDWMNEAGYGLMFHWTSQSVQPGGTIKPYEDAVNEFDVERFADMIEETGAGYMLLTIGHAESYCPAPIESWERVHPGHTTQRDLIEEIALALREKNIRLLCYMNGPLGFKFPRNGPPTDEQNNAFVENYTDILTEIGNRYGDKIAGYWFDSWYRIFESYPEFPFQHFFEVAKTGNSQRLICLNPWIYPDVTPWQDYWSGETQDPIAPPVNGYMTGGPSPHLPSQVLLTMEQYQWVQKKPEVDDPKFTSEELGAYIIKCMDNGGAVTINLAIHQDGTVGGKALEVMREVKELVR